MAGVRVRRLLKPATVPVPGRGLRYPFFVGARPARAAPATPERESARARTATGGSEVAEDGAAKEVNGLVTAVPNRAPGPRGLVREGGIAEPARRVVPPDTVPAPRATGQVARQEEPVAPRSRPVAVPPDVAGRRPDNETDLRVRPVAIARPEEA